MRREESLVRTVEIELIPLLVCWLLKKDQSKFVAFHSMQALFLHATSVGKLFAAHNPQLYRQLMEGDRPRLTEHTLVRAPELAAELATIRAQGYSVSHEEAILGVVGYALPISDAYGTMVAAIHTSVLRSGRSQPHERETLAAARAAVQAIESELGRVQPAVAGPPPDLPRSARR